MLISGESYNIGKIFSGNLRMQIPDMQRDYCWAMTFSENNNKSLVANFIEDLIGQIENNDGLQLGLLYAYESPKNNIQLCDGQQRLTTLYLLLCVLYMKTKNNDILSALILIENGENIPRFQYAIRESTLSFLTDFMNEVVLNKNLKEFDFTELKKEIWYFNEYVNDPSIENIVRSLEIINSRLIIFETEIISPFAKLSDLILNKISFLYFDMQNRTYGEEQFVVLNTTGKPLTKTENMKPLFLGHLNDSVLIKDGKTKLRHYADLWENWELFFWKNKHPEHQTADKGLNEFFRWIYIIESTDLNEILKSDSESHNKAQKALSSFRFNLFEIENNTELLLDKIQEYFTALQVINNDSDVKSKFLSAKQSLSQIHCFELLPLLSFARKFNVGDVNQANFIRLKNFLGSRSKDENISKASITTTLEAIRIPTLLKNNDIDDIVEYKYYQNEVSITLLTSCEIFKFHLLKKMHDQRIALEQAFWKAESLNTSQGNIEYLFKSLNLNVENLKDSISIDEFNKAVEFVKLTFENPTDLMRRALLTFGNYYLWNGNAVTLNSNRYSLGINAKFYGAIANNKFEESNASHLINFLTTAIKGIDEVKRETVDEWMNTLVNQYVTKTDNIWNRTRSKIIQDSEILDKMNNKLFCVSYDETTSFALFNVKVMSDDSYSKII